MISKKVSKVLTISAISFALSLGSLAMAKDAEKVAKPQEAQKAPVVEKTQTPKCPCSVKCGCCKVAVVDVQKLVENSAATNALKADRKTKLADLTKFVIDARADIDKEKDAAKKKSLEESYSKELVKKREAADKDYYKKVSEIDKNINDVIKAKAKKGNYSLILTKNSVLDGGDDITNEIIKELK